MADAVRNLDIVTRLKGAPESKAGFDGMSVSAKDLQTRIQDLDLRMNKLTTSLGKHAYESKAGIIITRERKLALEQLLAIEEKEQAITQKSVRGLGSLSSAALAASGSISGLGTGMSVLTNALMSGVGLTAGLAAAVAGFSLFMEYIRGANAEVGALTNKISGMIEVVTPSGKFNIKPEDLEKYITAAESRITKLQEETPPIGYFGYTQRKSTKTTEGYLEAFKKAKEDYNEFNAIMKEGNALGLKFTQDETKAMKEKETAVEALANAYFKLADAILDAKLEGEDMILGDYFKPTASDRSLGMRSGRFNLRGIDADIQAEQERMNKQAELYADLFKDAANVMRSEFGSAWESIFGEANSSFEKLISSWSETLLTKLGNSLIDDLLGFIPGGSIISSILGLGKASPGR